MQSFSMEEHFHVLSEPWSHNVSHFTPASGKAVDIANELFKIVKLNQPPLWASLELTGQRSTMDAQMKPLGFLSCTLKVPFSELFVNFIRMNCLFGKYLKSLVAKQQGHLPILAILVQLLTQNSLIYI